MTTGSSDEATEELQMQERLQELVDLERELRTRLDGLRVS